MSIFPDPLKYRQLHRLMVCLSVFLAAAVIWYVIMRLVHPYMRVQVKTIDFYRPAAETILSAELRVGCYNIAHGRGDSPAASNFSGGRMEDKLDRLKQIAQMINASQFDLIVLNEVDFAAVWSHHIDQAEYIARYAGFRYLAKQRNYDISFPFFHFRFGNALLSKYPILWAESLEFTPYSKLERWLGGNHDALLCAVQLPDDGIVKALAVHLEHRSEAVRVRCAQQIIELAQNSATPMIVMGDLNSTPAGFPGHKTDKSGKNALDTLIRSGLFRPMPVSSPPDPADFTFPSTEPSTIIDWVLTTKPYRISEKQVLMSDLSDHFPVMATISR